MRPNEFTMLIVHISSTTNTAACPGPGAMLLLSSVVGSRLLLVDV